ncbi:MAG TPA: putative sulfate exporter family transporter [Bryobacteraceae bacterium]|nr:putative sulfate exporter family transporter [Bryobacteraceae bacterium]
MRVRVCARLAAVLHVILIAQDPEEFLPPRSAYSYISDEALLSLDSMEGIHQLPKQAAAPPKQKAGPWWAYVPAALVTAVAYGVHYLPFPPFRVVAGTGARYPVSAAIIAMVAGVMARNLLPLPAAFVESAKGMARRIIPITIVLTGAGLNLLRVASAGSRSLLITLACMAVSMMAAVWIGGALGLQHRTRTLIGAGTAICGTSAIVAVAPLIDAEDEDLMLSIGTINILGLVLMFLLPALGGLLHLSDEAFGVWAGTTIHAVPQVVAAGFAFSAAAGALATLVKLVRVTMLAPLLFLLGLQHARRSGSAVAIQYSRLVPPFVYGFLALALCNTLGLFPALQFHFGTYQLSEVLANLAEFLLALSMAAMGLEVNVRFLANTGGRAVLTGAAASVVLCVVSLLLIRLLL